MGILKTLLIALIVACLGVSSRIEAEDFEYRILKNVIQPAERTTFIIRISGEILKKYRLYEDSRINDLLLIGKDELKLLSQKILEGNEFMEWQYELTSYNEGTVNIPPVEIIIGTETYSTEAIKFNVFTTRKIDDFELRPDFGLVNEDVNLFKLISLLLLIPFTFFIYRILKKYHLKKLIKFKPRKSIQSWIKDELLKLEREIENNNITLSGFDKLSFLIKKYFSLKTKKDVSAFTTMEFAFEFYSDIKKRNFLTILAKCDEIKYFSEKPKEIKNILLNCIYETRKNLSV